MSAVAAAISTTDRMPYNTAHCSAIQPSYFAAFQETYIAAIV